MRYSGQWPPRSWLISTVENERFVAKLPGSDAEAVILELEAGTHDKERARVIARDVLASVDFGGKYRVLRINPVVGDVGRLDLEVALPSGPDAVMLTKVKTPADVTAAEEVIREVEARNGMEVGATELAIMVEQTNAVFEVREIATATPRVRALCFGPGDYTVNTGGLPTAGSGYPVQPGIEVLVARSLVVAGCRAVGVTPIDGPTLVSVRDTRAIRVHAWESRALGFDGMICLSPTQVPPVNDAFTPTNHEVGQAREVIDAYEAALAAGKGVIGTGSSEMVSSTIADRYRDVLRRARVLATHTPR